MKPTFLLYAFAAWTVSAVVCGCGGGQGAPATQDRIAGEWIDARTGDWIYGFYDGYAVADNDFWSYESAVVTDREARLVLRCEDGESKGELREVVLRLDAACDSVATDRSRFWSRPRLVRTDRYVAASRRGKLKLDPALSFDSVTVKGRIAGAPAGRTVTANFNTILSDEEAGRAVETTTDSCGRFTLRMPCAGVSTLTVVCREERMYEFLKVSPAETVMMSYDFSDNTRKVRIMSRYARIDREWEDLMQWMSANGNIESPDCYAECSHEDYMLSCEQAYDKRLEMLCRYTESHPYVSEAFVEYMRMQMMDGYISDLAQRKFGVGLGESLPDDFIARTDSLIRMLRPPYTLISPITMDNALSMLPTKSWASGNIEALLYLDRKGLMTLTDDEREALDVCDRAIGDMFTPNRPEPSEDYKQRLAEANKVNERLWHEAEPLVEKMGDGAVGDIVGLQMSVLSKMAAIDRIGMDDTLRDMCVARLFLAHMMYKQHSLGEVFFCEMDSLLHDERMRRFIEAENAKFLQLEQNAVAYPESLQSNDGYAGISDAEELWGAITAPHAGKVLALDFWGTWCVPCKRELPDMAELMRDYEGRDVVFIYFATHSPEESWVNVLKDEGLTAANIVHFNLPPEQTDLLVRKFGVDSYPTHIVIDRNGTPLAEPVRGPLSGNDDLRQAIDRLIE